MEREETVEASLQISQRVGFHQRQRKETIGILRGLLSKRTGKTRNERVQAVRKNCWKPSVWEEDQREGHHWSRCKGWREEEPALVFGGHDKRARGEIQNWIEKESYLKKLMWLSILKRCFSHINGSSKNVSFHPYRLLQGNEDAKLRWIEYIHSNQKLEWSKHWVPRDCWKHKSKQRKWQHKY